jgi:hypothetical protein
MYATPQHVTDPSQCAFYHTMDLPQIGTVHGDWDLRDTIDDYLGHFDFTGKRCLDIGAAGGFLSFEMERRGAREVVSMDLEPAQPMDYVPYTDPDYGLDELREVRHARRYAVQRGYWLAHRLLGSAARMYYGTAYDLPAELGMFDVVVIGMMLPHTRDPFSVLEQAAARASETLIVVQQAPQIDDAWAYFMPDSATGEPLVAWWSMSELCLARMLGVLGFDVVSKIRAEHDCPERGDRESCTTQIAVRRNPERPALTAAAAPRRVRHYLVDESPAATIARLQAELAEQRAELAQCRADLSTAQDALRDLRKTRGYRLMRRLGRWSSLERRMPPGSS